MFASPQTLSPPFGAGSGDEHVALSVAREGAGRGKLLVTLIIIVLSNDNNVVIHSAK